MSLDLLDYNSLLEVAVKLSVEDLLVLREVHGKALDARGSFWWDLIQRRYGSLLKDATLEDYKFLLRYEEEEQEGNYAYFCGSLEDIPRVKAEYIISKLMEKQDIVPEIWPLIREALSKIEEEATGNLLLWTPNTHYSYPWGEAEGYFVRAKTRAGGVLALLERVPAFKEKLHEFFVCFNISLSGISHARLLRKNILWFKSFLTRFQDAPSFLPSLPVLDEIYSGMEEKSLLEYPGRYIDRFIEFMEGDPNIHLMPLLNSYRRVELI